MYHVTMRLVNNQHISHNNLYGSDHYYAEFFNVECPKMSRNGCGVAHLFIIILFKSLDFYFFEIEVTPEKS